MGAPSAKGKQKQVTTSATELGRAGAACLARWRRCVISADGGRPHPASRTSPGGRGDAGGSRSTRLSPRRGESASEANRWRAYGALTPLRGPLPEGEETHVVGPGGKGDARSRQGVVVQHERELPERRAGEIQVLDRGDEGFGEAKDLRLGEDAALLLSQKARRSAALALASGHEFLDGGSMKV